MCLEIRAHPPKVINIGTTAQTEKSLTNNIYAHIHIHTHTHTHFKNRLQSYLLVKIALRFLSRIPKIYVDPRGVAWGPTASSHMRHPGIRYHGDTPGSHSWFLASRR